MPRLLKSPRGDLGIALFRAMESLRLTPQQVAAAARINKGTLYKILSGETEEPHHSTLRCLCKVLHLDVAEITGAEQLELMDAKVDSETLSGIEQLLTLELESFPRLMRQQAVDIAVLALLEVKLGMGCGAGLLVARRATAGKTVNLRPVIRLLRGIPARAQPAAVRSALGALVDLRMIRGATPSPLLFERMARLRSVLWRGVEYPKRKRKTRRRRTPPLDSLPPPSNE